MIRRDRNSKALALFATGLLGLVGALLWSGAALEGTKVLPSNEARPRRVTAGSTAASAVPVAAPRDESKGRQGGQVDPVDPSGSRGSRARDGAQQAPTRGVVVRFRVSGGPADQPLAGVRVHAGGGHLVASSELRDLPSARAFQCDPVSVAIERLSVFESDAKGLIEVPLEGSMGLVAAVSVPATDDSPALEAWIHPSETQIRKRRGAPFPLRLRPRQEWTLRAVDRWGQGRAGVEVQAQFLRSSDLSTIAEGGEPSEFPFRGPQGHPWTRLLGTTDEDGLLVYARAPLIPSDSRSDDPCVAVLLAAQVPATEQIPILIEEIPPPGTVIELPMPPSGTVTTRLFDHDGRPLPGWHELHVLRRSTEDFTPLKTVQALNGTARIGGLPTGASLRLRLGAAAAAAPAPAVDIAGLQGDGSDSNAELHIGAGHAVLVGRLLDSEGQPLAHQSFEGRGAGWKATGAGTDSEGRFSVVAALSQARGLPQVLSLQVERACDDGDIVASSEYRARLDLPLDAATLDLGDLSPSGPLPLLAAGRVTMPGDGVCGSYDLEVQFRDPDGAWRELAGIETSIAAPDRFAIHGDPEPRTEHRLLLRVRGACRLSPEPIVFTPGTEGLHIEVDPGSSLSVRVATPLSVGSGRSLSSVLDFRLEAVGGAAASVTQEPLGVSQYGNVEPDGLVSLHWHGLRSGSFRLRVLARGTETVLTQMTPIAVSGAHRVAPGVLDLRDVLYRFRLNLVTPDGSPLKDASVRLAWAAESGQAATTLRGPHCVGLAPAIPVEIIVRARGYATERRALLPGSQEIEMQLARPVITRVEIVGLELSEGVHADLIWGPADLPRDVRDASGFALPSGAQGTVDEPGLGAKALVASHLVEIQQPGRPGPRGGLRLVLALSALPAVDRPDTPTRVLLDEMPGWVLPNPQPLTTTVVVDAAALRGALAEMGRE